MTFDHLRYFSAAAKLENVGAASRALHISPSAISHAIATLEEELGVRLFIRHGKRIQLNTEGRLLLEECADILGAVERLPQLYRGGSRELSGRFQIGATHSLALRFLVKASARIENQHPKLSFDFKIAPTTSLVSQLLGGQLDFALCYAPVSHPDIVTDVMQEDPFVIAIKKNHPLLKSPLKERPKILSQMGAAAPRQYSGSKNLEHPILEELKIEQNVNFIFDSYDLALERLRVSENSWALMPSSLLSPSSGVVPLKIADWSCTEKIIGAWFRPRGLPLACAAVFEACQKRPSKG